MNSIRVKATVNLPGLSAGEETMADGDTPYVKRMLEASFLQVVYPKGYLTTPVKEEPEVAVEQADDASNIGDSATEVTQEEA